MAAAATAAGASSPARSCALAWNAHSSGGQRAKVAQVAPATAQVIALRLSGATRCTVIFHYRGGDAAIASEATLGGRVVRWGALASFPPYMSRAMGGLLFRVTADGRLRV